MGRSPYRAVYPRSTATTAPVGAGGIEVEHQGKSVTYDLKERRDDPTAFRS